MVYDCHMAPGLFSRPGDFSTVTVYWIDHVFDKKNCYASVLVGRTQIAISFSKNFFTE